MCYDNSQALSSQDKRVKEMTDEIRKLVVHRQALKVTRDKLLDDVAAIREDIKKVNALIDRKLEAEKRREDERRTSN